MFKSFIDLIKSLEEVERKTHEWTWVPSAVLWLYTPVGEFKTIA